MNAPLEITELLNCLSGVDAAALTAAAASVLTLSGFLFAKRKNLKNIWDSLYQNRKNKEEFYRSFQDAQNSIRQTQESIHQILNKIDAIISENNQRDIDEIRWKILDFSNSCRHGRKHSKDEFSHIIAANDRYHTILEANGLENGQIDIEFEYISELYKRCLENDDFLT